jgi:putative glutamine amidotransferase
MIKERPSGLRIGVSSCMMHPDPTRALFKGKRLLYMEESMFHWVMSQGAFAFLLPTAPPAGATIEDMVKTLDGVVLSGGVDMAPESYGETPLRPEWSGDRWRDVYDLAIVKAALALDKPILGVCRGHQVMNVALGGTLFQDIATQKEGARVHRDWDAYEDNRHAVRLESQSSLGHLYGGVHESTINSVHHQAVKDLAKELVAEAFSPEDGIVEAVRLRGRSDPYLRGVQWHPEFQKPGDAALLSPTPILEDFMAAVKRRAR